MKAYTATRCAVCGHEAVRHLSVKRCRECGGRLERPTPSDATLARLRLAKQIVARARLWAAHDDVLRELIRRWETE